MHFKGQVGLPLFGKKGWQTFSLSGQLLALLLPTKRLQAREMQYRLPKNPLIIWTFWVVQGRKFLSQMPQGYTFSILTVFFGRHCPRSIIRAHPALLKLASVITTSCFPGMGCFNANWQASLRALLTESNIFFQFWRKIDWHFRFKQFVERIKFLGHSGNILSVVVHETQISL